MKFQTADFDICGISQLSNIESKALETAISIGLEEYYGAIEAKEFRSGDPRRAAEAIRRMKGRLISLRLKWLEEPAELKADIAAFYGTHGKDPISEKFDQLISFFEDELSEYEEWYIPKRGEHETAKSGEKISLTPLRFFVRPIARLWEETHQEAVNGTLEKNTFENDRAPDFPQIPTHQSMQFLWMIVAELKTPKHSSYTPSHLGTVINRLKDDHPRSEG